MGYTLVQHTFWKRTKESLGRCWGQVARDVLPPPSTTPVHLASHYTCALTSKKTHLLQFLGHHVHRFHNAARGCCGSLQRWWPRSESLCDWLFFFFYFHGLWVAWIRPWSYPYSLLLGQYEQHVLWLVRAIPYWQNGLPGLAEGETAQPALC